MQSFQLVGFSAYGGINLFFVETQFRIMKMYLHFFTKQAAISVTLILEKKPQQIQGKMLAIC